MTKTDLAHLVLDWYEAHDRCDVAWAGSDFAVFIAGCVHSQIGPTVLFDGREGTLFTWYGRAGDMLDVFLLVEGEQQLTRVVSGTP